MRRRGDVDKHDENSPQHTQYLDEEEQERICNDLSSAAIRERRLWSTFLAIFCIAIGTVCTIVLRSVVDIVISVWFFISMAATGIAVYWEMLHWTPNRTNPVFLVLRIVSIVPTILYTGGYVSIIGSQMGSWLLCGLLVVMQLFVWYFIRIFQTTDTDLKKLESLRYNLKTA